MNIFYVKKQAGRLYKSEEVFKKLCESENLGDFELSHDDSGAPRIEGGPFISISDTKGYWCCVLSDCACGIDMEEKRKVVPSLVKRFHKYEQEYLSGLEEGGSEWLAEVLSIWTRKEAYMKYCGKGIRMGLSSFSVIDKDLSCKHIIDSKKGPAGYIYDIRAPYGVTAALCAENEAVSISYIDLAYAGEAAKPALEKAADMLSERMYSREELRKKLIAKCYSEEEADHAVRELIERGYIDDSNYAEIYARHAASSGKGNRRIKTELRLKGISGTNAEKAIQNLAEEESGSERERAMKVAEKMPCTNEKEKARIARKLAGLGYESCVVYDIINRLQK